MEPTSNLYAVLGQARVSEDDVWQALADDHGLDVMDIMDGDLAEWL